MLTEWLSQQPATVGVQLALAFSVFALFLCWLSFWSPLSPAVQSCRGVVPPFVNVTATIFGLMVTFLAQDIWEANRQALLSVHQEREQLLTLRALSEVGGPADVELRAKIRDYVEAVVGLEWGRMENGEAAPEADAALDALTRFVAKASPDPRLEHALIDTTLRLRSAREQRLGIANAYSDERKWTAVFLMAFLSQIGLAAAHLERARPQLLSQAIFAAAAVVSLSLVAAIEKPFQPPNETSAAPLSEILSQIR